VHVGVRMSRRHFFAIGIFAGLTILCQIALTRLFSVVQYYHGAFLAISLALFGFAVSGVFVFLRPQAFRREHLDRQLGRYGTLFVLAVPASFCFYLYLGVEGLLRALGLPAGRSLPLVTLEYVLLAVPFFASGICISLLLYHGASQANRLYAVDLISSATGAVLVIPCLGLLGGPKTMLFATALGALGVLPFRAATRAARWLAPAAGAAALLALLAAPQSAFNQFVLRKPPLVVASEPIFWNAFSMVGVGPEREAQGYRMRNIIIDNSVATAMVGAAGNGGDSAWTRRDWNAAAHRLKPGAEVLIIGSGGGRDIHVARAHGPERVWAVEVNPLVVRMSNEVFGDFTGSVYSEPGVEPVLGDARSFIANSSDRYGIILASLIDTWAASAAGAFALTENLLYTSDAFRDYYDHLADDGILSVSRWHPLETPRLLATGLEAWKREGVADPRKHAVLLVTGPAAGMGNQIVVLLMKKSPFTAQDIRSVEAFCAETVMVCALTPWTVRDPLVAQSLRAWEGSGAPEGWSGLDIAPVSDERPFFFNMLKPSTQALRMLGLRASQDPAGFQANLEATRMLVLLLVTVVVLLALTIALPLLRRGGGLGAGGPWILAYFTCLGLGYILIEIGLIQRLILLLGKPVYSLALILSTMLLASGTGSFVAGRPSAGRMARALPGLLLGTAAILAVLAFFAPAWIRGLLGTPFALRVAASLLLVALPAFPMGMAFPSALRLLGESGRTSLVPWVWGVNGATSVLASVLAIVLAIEFGYTLVFLLGAACYLGASLSFRAWGTGRPAPAGRGDGG